jgi:PAS domain S-box-containing protein
LQLKIRRFTTSTTQLLNVIGTDVGRPISDITWKFTDPGLIADAETVLRTLAGHEKDVQSKDGRWWLRRITPYRTSDNRIEGIVLTFTDVTRAKHAAEQAQLLASVLKSSGDAIFVHDMDGRLTHWNRGAEKLYGYTETEALHMNLRTLMPEKARQEYRGIMDRLKLGETADSWEAQRIAKDGRVLDVWITLTPLVDETGRPIAVAKTDRDITERKRAQAILEQQVEQRTAALRDREARLRAILNAPHDAIITITGDGAIESVNPAAEHMFGYQAAEMIGRKINLLVHDGFTETLKHAEQQQDKSQSSMGTTREVEVRRRDGTLLAAEWSIARVENMDLYTGVIRDITRRKELEREVLDIATQEQQRIGQDLHDQCGQELTALGLYMQTLYESLTRQSSADAPVAQKIGDGLARLLRQVRNISQGLVGPANAAKLPDALRELAFRLGETSGVQCEFFGPDDLDLANPIAATQMFHIAQEACTNALKHARPKKLAIRMRSSGNTVTLEVVDDGGGIPENYKVGLGMRIMRNRARMIGARLDIKAVKPSGTLVTCTLGER